MSVVSDPRSVHHLIRSELEAIVAWLQLRLYLEENKWSLNKDVNGAALVDSLNSLTEEYGLAPTLSEEDKPTDKD